MAEFWAPDGVKLGSIEEVTAYYSTVYAAASGSPDELTTSELFKGLHAQFGLPSYSGLTESAVKDIPISEAQARANVDNMWPALGVPFDQVESKMQAAAFDSCKPEEDWLNLKGADVMAGP